MKKNNKGFTLIELLAVIVILAIIALIATPIVLNLIKRARLGAAQDSAYGLRKAAQLYYATSLISDPNFSEIIFTCSETEGCVYKYTEAGEEKTKTLEIDGTKPSSGNVKIESNGTITYENIKYNNNAYTCAVPDSGKIECDEVSTSAPAKVYTNGEVVYYNPVEGKACTESQYNTDLGNYKTTNSVTTPTGQKDGCLKWYAFNDSESSTNVKLLLDHNTTARVAWNSSGSNLSPATIRPEITKLKTESGWQETARLITANEVAQVTGKISWDSSDKSAAWFYLDSKNQTQTANSSNKSSYAWLFDYTNGCTTRGCNVADGSNYGYWTSSPYDGYTNHVWRVNCDGNLISNDANSTYYGVRPVIETQKSNL